MTLRKKAYLYVVHVSIWFPLLEAQHMIFLDSSQNLIIGNNTYMFTEKSDFKLDF